MAAVRASLLSLQIRMLIETVLLDKAPRDLAVKQLEDGRLCRLSLGKSDPAMTLCDTDEGDVHCTVTC